MPPRPRAAFRSGDTSPRDRAIAHDAAARDPALRRRRPCRPPGRRPGLHGGGDGRDDLRRGARHDRRGLSRRRASCSPQRASSPGSPTRAATGRPSTPTRRRWASPLPRSRRPAMRRATDVAISLDIAASDFGKGGRYRLAREGRELDTDGMIAMLLGWLERYPIRCIEDPLAEDDEAGLIAFTEGGKGRRGRRRRLPRHQRRPRPPRGRGRRLQHGADQAEPGRDADRDQGRLRCGARRRAGRHIVSARSGETEDVSVVAPRRRLGRGDAEGRLLHPLRAHGEVERGAPHRRGGGGRRLRRARMAAGTPDGFPSGLPAHRLDIAPGRILELRRTASRLARRRSHAARPHLRQAPSRRHGRAPRPGGRRRWSRWRATIRPSSWRKLARRRRAADPHRAAAARGAGQCRPAQGRVAPRRRLRQRPGRCADREGRAARGGRRHPFRHRRRARDVPDAGARQGRRSATTAPCATGDWTAARDRLEAFELAGRTLLLIGFGRIGRALAVARPRLRA